METKTLERHEMIAARVVDAWNSQDVNRVLACYTEDVVYIDPNTRGPIHGKAALSRYLTKLFTGWDMIWETRELLPLAVLHGTTLLVRATIRKKGGAGAVTIDGLEIGVLEGNLLKRDEFYFDRSLLAPLMSA